MDGHVAIRMGLQSLVVGDRDAGEHQQAGSAKAVGINTLSN